MKNNRYVIVAIGILVMLLAGVPYAWSVISAPIAKEFTSWSKAQLSLTFTLVMIFFCLGGLLAGNISKKTSVKVNVFISSLLFVCGFFITSRAQSLESLYCGFGVLCGLAAGFSYNSVMSTMTQWFPNKQGLISGILLMGFGFSSMIIGFLFTAVSSDSVGSWRGIYKYFGFAVGLILLACIYFFNKPEKNQINSSSDSIKAAKNTSIDYTPAQMLKTSSFWFYFFWAICISAAGLAIISQANSFAGAVGYNKSSSTLAITVGMISICNGFGRVAFGALYDNFGRKADMISILICFSLSIVILICSLIFKSFVLIIIGFIFLGFSYGGVTSTNSAFINNSYGTTNYPVNFSIINMNLIIASFGSTAAGLLYDFSGSYMSTLILMLCLSFFALVCFLNIKNA